MREPYKLFLEFGTGDDPRDDEGKVIPFCVGYRLWGLKLIGWTINLLAGPKVDILGNGAYFRLPRRGPGIRHGMFGGDR